MRSTEEQTRMEALVNRHMHIVEATARRYDRPGAAGHILDREDLVQAGSIGLIEAAESWDAEKRPDFARYASVRVKEAVLKEIRSAVNEPHWLQDHRCLVRRATAKSGIQEGTKEAEAFAAALDAREASRRKLSLSTVTSSRKAPSDRPFSLDVHAHSGDSSGQGSRNPGDTSTLGESIEDLGPSVAVLALDACERSAIRRAVDSLPEPFRSVSIRHFFEEQTIKEIAIAMGLHRDTISLRLREAYVMLRGRLSDLEGLTPPLVRTEIPHADATSDGRPAGHTALPRRRSPS